MATTSIDTFEAVLLKIPLCVRTTVIEAVPSKCGSAILCLCKHSSFLAFVQKAVWVKCNPEDRATTLGAFTETCSVLVPSLKRSRAPAIKGVTASLMALSTIAVLLRLTARWLPGSEYGTDDALIIISLLATHGMNITYLIGKPRRKLLIIDGRLIDSAGAVHGSASHMIMLSIPALADFSKSYLAVQVIFAWSTTLTKLSILFFYQRIFPIRKFKITSLIIGLLIMAWCLVFTIAMLLDCRPLAYFWDKTIKGGYCPKPSTSRANGLAAGNIVTDIAVMILPVPWLWNLQMARGRKFAVAGIFGLGSLVCVTAIIRIPLLTEFDFSDVTWTSIAPGLWILTECNIGIVSACLPTIRPILKTTFVKAQLLRVSSVWKGIVGFRRRRRKADLKSTLDRGSWIIEISPEFRFDEYLMSMLPTSSGGSGTNKGVK